MTNDTPIQTVDSGEGAPSQEADKATAYTAFRLAGQTDADASENAGYERGKASSGARRMWRHVSAIVEAGEVDREWIKEEIDNLVEQLATMRALDRAAAFLESRPDFCQRFEG